MEVKEEIKYAVLQNIYVKPIIITETDDETGLITAKDEDGNTIPGYISKRHVFSTKKEALLDLSNTLVLFLKRALRELSELESKEE